MSDCPNKFFIVYAAWHDFGLVCRKTLHLFPNDTPGDHQHCDFYELVLVVSGNGRHRTNDREWEIQSGNVFLVPPNQVHCYTKYDNLLIYNLLFTQQFLMLMLQDLSQLPGFQLLFNLSTQTAALESANNLRIDSDAFPDVVCLLEEMDNLKDSMQPGDKTLLLSKFARVMYLLARYTHWGCCNCRINSIEQLSKLLCELQKNYSASWSLEKMARFCNMGISSFRQNFRKFTKSSPIEYLLRLRINQAAILLKTSSEPLTRIAFACGFTDINYFSRQFKKYYNILPSQYRKISRSINLDQPNGNTAELLYLPKA